MLHFFYCSFCCLFLYVIFHACFFVFCWVCLFFVDFFVFVFLGPPRPGVAVIGSAESASINENVTKIIQGSYFNLRGLFS